MDSAMLDDLSTRLFEHCPQLSWPEEVFVAVVRTQPEERCRSDWRLP